MTPHGAKNEVAGNPLNPVRTRRYGGIGRPSYVIIIVCLLANPPFLTEILANAGYTGRTGGLLLLLALFASALRLKNIGSSQWWCLLVLVPFANLGLIAGCLALQEGYAETKRMDKPGKILLWFSIPALLLYLVANFRITD